MMDNGISAENLNETEIKTVADFLKTLNKRKEADEIIYFYRGENSIEYSKPLPKIFRPDYKKNAEKGILEEFSSYFRDSFHDKTAFEKLALAQHYGLPTRLLDITSNPLVALYFACQGKPERKSCGRVYIFAILRERVILFPDSDRLNIVCHLAYRRRKIIIQQNAKMDLLKELDSLGINEMTLFPEMEYAAKYLTGKYKESQ